jgi:hypothetical protein
MVDRCRQVLEEPCQRGRIGGVERRGASRAELQPGLLQATGVAAGEDDVGTLGRARRAVCSPIPALPPITTTVCPANSGSRWAGTSVVAPVMIPPWCSP